MYCGNSEITSVFFSVDVERSRAVKMDQTVTRRRRKTLM